MKLTREQREKILRLFPKQRGNVKVDNSRFLDAVIYICENGCKWRPFLKPSALGIPPTSESTTGQKMACWNGFFTPFRKMIDNEQADNGGFPGFHLGKSLS
jgi:hypothetical protein